MNMDESYLEFEEPTPEKEKDNTKKIIAIVALVLLFCCCGFVLSGWFVWGDPLMRLLGLLN